MALLLVAAYALAAGLVSCAEQRCDGEVHVEWYPYKRLECGP